MATPPSTRYKILKIFGRGIQLVRQSPQVFSLQTIVLRGKRKMQSSEIGCRKLYVNRTMRQNTLTGTWLKGNKTFGRLVLY